MTRITVFRVQRLKYLIILIIAFFLTSNILFSQQISDKIQLGWTISKINSDTSGKTEKYLNFPGSILVEKYGRLPVYSNSLPLNCDCNFKVEIVNPEYQAVPRQELIQSSEIGSVADIKEQLSYINGKPYANFSVLPFRKNATTGQIEILNSFSIKIITTGEIIKPALKKVRSSDHSVLASGDWYKIQVSATGIYKIDYNFLKSLGINPDQINPKHIKLYGNGGGMLPQSNDSVRINDLAEDAIYVYGEADEKFDKQDYILFYAKGPHYWEYNSSESIFKHQLNSYSDSAYFFLTIGNDAGKRIVVKPNPSGTVSYSTSTYDYLDYHELNLLTDISDYVKSGRDLFGEDFNFTKSRTFPFYIPNLDLNSPVKIDVEVAARSGLTSSFDILADGNTFSITIPRAYIDDYNSDYIVPQRQVFTFQPTQANLDINLKYHNTTANSVGWLNYIVLNSRADLNFTGNQLSFRDTGAINKGISEFQITNSFSDMLVWNITDQTNVEQQSLSITTSKYVFRIDGNKLYEFIAFRQGSGLTPAYGKKIPNQDLHSLSGVDYVIVTYPDFMESAEKLADFHRNSDTLQVAVVTPAQIYNEFSSGAQDITAIRDFMKMLYDKGGNGIKKPKYLLLFGDASYDYKNLIKDNTNFVPTYESYSSYSPTYSYASDDYYGFLDDNEGEYDDGGYYNKSDIGIGRFPVQTTQQAKEMVNKVINYKNKKSFADWRNNLMLIADDEDGNTYFNGSETLDYYFASNTKELNVTKIYLDAFQQVTTPGGNRYPEVQKAIDKKVNSGCFAVNYIGHGGEQYLAHEKVIELSDIKSWTNFDRLSLFVTATCEFTRFDDPERISAGEWVWLNPDGGAICMLTTTRVVFSSENDALINNLYKNNLFNENNGNFSRIGDITKVTKNRSGFSVNTRKFALLGDPALILDYPRHEVITTSINSRQVDSLPDTLKALSIITVSGEIRDHQNVKLDNFNGVLYPIIYDKPSDLKTLANDPQNSSVAKFKMFTNIIYKGVVSVEDGSFTFSFVVPKDISYKFGEGKISYYATDDITDANGEYDNIIIGGSISNFPKDSIGPEVQLFMNDSNFIRGGITNESPWLYAKVRDESGINTVGNGIGHEIIGVLDDGDPIVLNDYYRATLNNYKEGIINYPFSNLSAGKHKLYIKVWDVMNNSAEDSTEFVVAPSAQPEIRNLFNYPNPVNHSTIFSFETNLSGQDIKTTLQIFSSMGELVRTLETNFNTEASRVLIEKWDAQDTGGQYLPSGIYFYRLILQDSKGQVVSKSNKLILVN
jgi:hypothetical protein